MLGSGRRLDGVMGSCDHMYSGVTHCDSLCLTVDLQRTEAFWEMELLKINGRWTSLPLLEPIEFRSKHSVWLFKYVVDFSVTVCCCCCWCLFTSSSRFLNSSSSFWSLTSWMSFFSRSSSASISFTWTTSDTRISWCVVMVTFILCLNIFTFSTSSWFLW